MVGFVTGLTPIFDHSVLTSYKHKLPDNLLCYLRVFCKEFLILLSNQQLKKNSRSTLNQNLVYELQRHLGHNFGNDSRL